MKEVLIESGNSNIWNFELKVVEIIKSIVNDNKVFIDLNSEGPCCSDIGLYNILDYICDQFSLEKEDITIQTANALEHHNEYNIIKNNLSTRLHNVKQGTCQDTRKNFFEDFKNFGIFIGRPSWERTWISSSLWKSYPTKVFGTFHWNKNSDYHLTHTNLTDILRFSNNLDVVIDSSTFLKKCPYILDFVSSFPILSDRYCDIMDYYKNFFLEIACETYFSGNTFFPTEKTWRSIATKTPFIIYGPVGFLRNLRKLGFKTFDNWWSEEYDDYGHEARIEKIIELSDTIAKYSSDELYDMYKDMSEVLEHNFRIFNKISENDFQRVFK